MCFKEHPLRIRSPFEVFNLEAKVRQESKEITMDLFVESLAKSLDTDSLVSVEDKIRALQIENEVKEVMLGYIENR